MKLVTKCKLVLNMDVELAKITNLVIIATFPV
jgi:hypothetical protein